MKKFFSLVAAVLAVLAVNATVVTLLPSDFSAATSAATSATVSGVTADLTTGTITADQIRIFKNQTITISSESAISAIVFTCTANDAAQYGPGCFEAQDGYSFENKYGTWLGNATSVAFKAASNQVRATKIEVYLDGETPSGESHAAIQVTVAEAITAGMALDSMATSDAVYEVTGYVVNSQPYNNDYKNQIWFMADEAANTANQEFEAYACVVKENGVVKQVVDGDKVVLTGSLTKYYDKNQSKFIVEIKNGTAAFVEKAEGDHDLPEVKVDTITVAQAIEEANKLTPAEKQSATTDATFAVKGYIASIKDAYSSQYGNMTFYMSDDATATRGDLQAYRCKLSAEDAEKAVVGAYVLVTGKIQNYNGGTFNSYEIAQGTVEILGEAPEVIATEVTVAQALEIAQALTPEVGISATADGLYAVKGFIVNVKDAEKKTYYMADEAGAYGEFQAYRCASVDYEVAEGDYVIVTGKISTYHGEGQNGEYYSYEISGGTLKHVYGQGVENVVMGEKAQKVMVDGVLYIVREGKMYNVQGAQVR